MSVELLERCFRILMNGVSDLNESVQVTSHLLHHPLMLILLYKCLLNLFMPLLFFINSCLFNLLYTNLFRGFLFCNFSFFILDFFGGDIFFRRDSNIFFAFGFCWLFRFRDGLFLVLDLFNILFSGLFSFRCHINY